MRRLLPSLLIVIQTWFGHVHADEQEQSSANNSEPPMVMIAPGSFNMGSNIPFSDEKPIHQVNIGYAFELGQTEVTQGQWKAVMGENPSHFSKCGNDCPVENVSWQDVVSFIKQLNVKTGKEFRLPSEAEWEYACRAGKNDEYCGGSSIDKVAWYQLNGGARTSSAAQKAPNGWGLYDMSGNVWEWTQDCWNKSYNGAPTDGSAWESGDCGMRVIRGGSWSNSPDYLRAANRFKSGSGTKEIELGFRVARSLK
ncbi:MAG: formylglycine-generating enzyme family protein [Nitrosomonadales bacterium]|nr:formylglycine-generating enzyme family protein [Nitrosomonadales bacterium]